MIERLQRLNDFSYWRNAVVVAAHVGCLQSCVTPASDKPVDQEHHGRSQHRVDLYMNSQDGTRLTIDLVFAGSAQGDRPRVVDVSLLYTSNVELVSTVAGRAVERASKQLFSRQKKIGHVRTVALSGKSLEGVEPGTIATYVFDYTGDGPVTVEIEPSNQIFAPASANEGLLIGDPLTLKFE